jgi:hypothetical protein
VSLPIITVEAAVLDGLGEVRGGDAPGVVEVRDGAGDLQHSVVSPGAEPHAADGHFEGALAGAKWVTLIAKLL